MLREPPKKGSLRESILLMYVMRQQNIAFLSQLALAQVIINKKSDTFEDLRKEMFPWLETIKEKDKTEHIKKLFSEIKDGPLAVSALAVPSVKSRLNKQVKRLRKPADEDALNDLYKKTGSMF